MMSELVDFKKEDLLHELPSYEGTPVEMIDIIAGYMRLSYLFDIPAKDIRADFIFRKELKPSFESDFRANEFRWIEYDLEDILDGLDISEPVDVFTVKDYITLLSRCRLTAMDYYKSLVKSWLNTICKVYIGPKGFSAFFEIFCFFYRPARARFFGKRNFKIVEFVQKTLDI